MTGVQEVGVIGDPHLEKRRAASERRQYLLLLAVPLAVLLVFFVYPVISFLVAGISDSDEPLSQFTKIIGDPLYLKVIYLTFKTAFITTLLCLLLGYPLAYAIAGMNPWQRQLALICVILPFFVSLIVRTYAWMVLLGSRGLLNSFLIWSGITDSPLALLYTRTGTTIGMTYVMLPFMVLTCYSVIRNIDASLVRAAFCLGASRWQSFVRIVLPLSLPGVVGGTILVFIMSLGFFITPRLMGGPADLMIAMLIEHEIELNLNWPFAAALSTILLILTLVGFAAYVRLVRLERLFEAAR